MFKHLRHKLYDKAIAEDCAQEISNTLDERKGIDPDSWDKYGGWDDQMFEDHEQSVIDYFRCGSMINAERVTNEQIN